MQPLGPLMGSWTPGWEPQTSTSLYCMFMLWMMLNRCINHLTCALKLSNKSVVLSKQTEFFLARYLNLQSNKLVSERWCESTALQLRCHNLDSLFVFQNSHNAAGQLNWRYDVWTTEVATEGVAVCVAVSRELISASPLQRTLIFQLFGMSFKMRRRRLPTHFTTI